MIVDSVASLERFASSLLAGWRSSRSLKRRLVLLDGPMGAGKTEFVKALLKSLRIDDLGASPTFALHHRYSGQQVILDHLDLFRLQSEEELESIGFWDLLSEPAAAKEHIIVAEWASRLGDFGLEIDDSLGWSRTEIEISVLPDQRRELVVKSSV